MVTVVKVTSAPNLRRRYARSTVQMDVVRHSCRNVRRSQWCALAPSALTTIRTHASPQSQLYVCLT